MSEISTMSVKSYATCVSLIRLELIRYHRRRKVKNIGGPRFRILGGPRGTKFPVGT